MRTNIVIDDKLMAEVMALGGYKTKKEAVEEGLRLLKRKKAYADLLAARGTLFWDDSDEAWAAVRHVEPTALMASEPSLAFTAKPVAKSKPTRARPTRKTPAARSKAK